MRALDSPSRVDRTASVWCSFATGPYTNTSTAPSPAYSQNTVLKDRWVDQSKRRPTANGTPATAAPNADAPNATRLYRANRAVRCSAPTSDGSSACSAGRKALTSPADGFSGPKAATSSKGTNQGTRANKAPVNTMATAQPRST